MSLCTASGASMMVRESTYAMTSLAFNTYLEGERLAGVVSLSYFLAAMPMNEAVRRYADPVKQCAVAIGIASAKLPARDQAPA